MIPNEIPKGKRQISVKGLDGLVDVWTAAFIYAVDSEGNLVLRTANGGTLAMYAPGGWAAVWYLAGPKRILQKATEASA